MAVPKGVNSIQLTCTACAGSMILEFAALSRLVQQCPFPSETCHLEQLIGKGLRDTCKLYRYYLERVNTWISLRTNRMSKLLPTGEIQFSELLQSHVEICIVQFDETGGIQGLMFSGCLERQ